jgi:hypothetical protein
MKLRIDEQSDWEIAEPESSPFSFEVKLEEIMDIISKENFTR